MSDFRKGVISVLCLSLIAVPHAGAQTPVAPARKAAKGATAARAFDPDKMINLKKMKPRGTWEEVTWPVTLDLSDRARIALEGALTLNPDPAHHYIYAAGFGFRG